MYKRGEFYADSEFNQFSLDSQGGKFLKYNETCNLDSLDSVTWTQREEYVWQMITLEFRIKAWGNSYYQKLVKNQK